MNKEILSVVELVSQEKSIPREKIFDALEVALTIATKKQYTYDIHVRVSINRENGDLNTFRRWMIVDRVTNPEKEITLKQARITHHASQISEYVENKIQSINFDRVSTQEAKNIIIKKVREVERLMMSNKFHACKGQILQGIVKTINRDFVILDLGYYIEAIILRKEMLPKEQFVLGDRIRGVLYEIRSKSNGIQLFISRARAEMLIELFRIEVPEINKNLISVQSVSRDPGLRAKVAVKTNDKKIDPVGACVGVRGSRVQCVSKEMNGERIDIILWDRDPVQFVINSMSPVRVVSVIMHQNIHAMDIIVQANNLAQAIGKHGQNVRLAAQLTGWELNIMIIDDLKNKNKININKIRAIFSRCLDLNIKIIDLLVYAGLSSLPELVCTPYHVLMNIIGINSRIVNIVQEQSDNYLNHILIVNNCHHFE